MKNIFTTKVRWFKKEPKKPIEYDWTHVYTNSLGHPVLCIIQRGDYTTGSYVWVLNVNGCGVGMSSKDLETIEQYNLRVNK